MVTISGSQAACISDMHSSPSGIVSVQLILGPWTVQSRPQASSAQLWSERPARSVLPVVEGGRDPMGPDQHPPPLPPMAC